MTGDLQVRAGVRDPPGDQARVVAQAVRAVQVRHAIAVSGLINRLHEETFASVSQSRKSRRFLDPERFLVYSIHYTLVFENNQLQYSNNLKLFTFHTEQ